MNERPNPEEIEVTLVDPEAQQEPEEKREGLTEGETEQWLGMFGLDE